MSIERSLLIGLFLQGKDINTINYMLVGSDYMIDKNKKEIKVGDKVRWKTTWSDDSVHVGIVVCCLPKYEHMPENIRMFLKSKDYKMDGRYMNSAIDRVIVEVERPKSCPMLYTPRPSSVEVFT